MNACPSCEIARNNPLTTSFHAHCLRCQERSLAHSQDFWESEQSGMLSDGYLKALVRFFGADDAAAAHLRIKTWASLIRGSAA